MTDSPFLTVQEAADQLKCSRGKIYAMADRNELKMTKLNGKTVVLAEQVLAFEQKAIRSVGVAV